MAHILVYLQRAPRGLHPASAVALCLARNLGSLRGATITAVCPGEATLHDARVAAAAGRHGADRLWFCGPRGLEELHRHLMPVHVLTPWTAEGQAAVAGLPTGPIVPRWVSTPRPAWGAPDAVSGIVAGTPPWVDLDTALEPEYQAEAGQVPLAPWLAAHDADTSDGDSTDTAADTGGHFVATGAMDEGCKQALERLGAVAGSAQDVEQSRGGIHWWLARAAVQLPDALGRRDPASQLVLLPGEQAQIDPSWALADWVIPGPWLEALASLQSPPWRRAMT